MESAVVTERAPVQEVEPVMAESAVVDPKKDRSHLGTCFIFSSKNCTIIMVTDLTGSETYAKVSGGMKVKSKKEEGSPYAAILAAQDAAERAKKCGITACNIKIRGRGGIKRKNFGQGAQSALRTFISSGIKVGRIECVTPIPSDGCRRKCGHRGRRV